MKRKIEFTSQHAQLHGWMYIPELCKTACPTIIMGHGFSSTIDMTAEQYAEGFSSAGYTVILYDHRNLGSSEGAPRQNINYWVQARGYIDCIDFAVNQPEVDPERIALWGCSSSGRLTVVVASIDHRPKAIVAQVPALGAAPDSSNYGDLAHNEVKQMIMHNDISSLKHQTVGPMAVASRDQHKLPSYLPHPTAAEWFLTCGGRPGSKWLNEVTVSRTEAKYTFHPQQCAKHIKSSVLFVVADDDEIEAANPAVAREIFDRIDQPKQWVDIHGGHFGLLYYPSTIFDEVLSAEIAFMDKHL